MEFLMKVGWQFGDETLVENLGRPASPLVKDVGSVRTLSASWGACGSQPPPPHSDPQRLGICRLHTSQKMERVARELCSAARIFSAVILVFLSLRLGSWSSRCQMPPRRVY